MAPSRIEELRRRVQADPASIAFAQLAEEYRRSGQTDEAVRVCREGLTRHPGYLSARVTLGRALLDLNELDAARAEFEFVVAEAPENLAAVRGLAEISQRDGQFADALNYYRRALALARHDPEIEEIVQQLSRQVGVAATTASGGLSFEEAHRELLSAAERVPVVPPRPAPALPPVSGAPTAPFDFDRLVAALGSPAAPPQLEAAVEGRATAVPAFEMAETIDLGPNPFAALEAELRAHESAAVASGGDHDQSTDTGRYEGSAARAGRGAVEGESPDSPEAVLEDTLLVGSADLAPATDAEEPRARDDASADAPTVTLSLSPAPVAEPGLGERDGLEAVEPAAPETFDIAAATEVPADTTPGPQPAHDGAAPTSEDVLDDLESWLDTLHDRSAS